MSSASILEAVESLPTGREGFVELEVNKAGAELEAGRRWLWSDSRLSAGGFGRWDWGGDWNAGVRLKYEF